MEFFIRPEGYGQWHKITVIEEAAEVEPKVFDELRKFSSPITLRRPPLTVQQKLSAEIILNSSITDSLDISDS